VQERTRAETVAGARARADRAHERFLHDTVLNTLAGIGLGGAAGTPALELVRSRCRRVVDQVENLLLGAGDLDGAAARTDPDAGLAALVTGVLEEAADDRLDVAYRFVRVDRPRWRPRALERAGVPPEASPARQPLPADVAAALAAALREALTNIRRHAGVAAARVTVIRWLDGVRIRIDDAGVGFDPAPLDLAGIDPARFDPAGVAAAGVARAGIDPAGVARAGGDRVRVDRARLGPAYVGPAGVDPAGVDSARVDLARGAVAPFGATSTRAGSTADGTARARLGLRGSVYGRMADVGGWAQVLSRPGVGTRVELHWQAAPRQVIGPDHGANLRRDYEAATRRGVGVAVLTGVALLALPAFFFRHLVHPSVAVLRPVAPVASPLLWILTAAGAVWLVAIMWRRPLRAREALATLGYVVAVILGGAAITSGGQVIRIYDWAGTVAPGILLLPITASRPVRQWAPALAVIIGVVLAVGLPRIGPHPLDVVRLLGAVYSASTIQLLVTIAGPLVRATAAATTAAAARDAELGAGQDAAAAVRRDRARGLARLNRDVLPLLRAVAEGAADPRDDRVQRLCASRARALRRMLVGGAGGPAGPFVELETAIDAAEARGALVVLQVAGQVDALPAEVREELVELLSETLRAAPPGRVTVTLLCDGGAGYISFPAAHAAAVEPPRAVADSTRTVPDVVQASPVGEAPADAVGRSSAGARSSAGGCPTWTSALVARTELDEDNTVVELRWPVLDAA
jgi:hypothetical protein